MSAAPFLIPLIAIMSSDNSEKEKRKKELAIELLQKSVKDEKTFILLLRALSWKSDKDIVATYDEILNGNLEFDSMKEDVVFEQKTRAQKISIGDFIAFLSQTMGRKETIRVLNENHLFKRTLETHPEDISLFIIAANCHESAVCRYNGYDNGYMVENDIFENRKQLFQSYCLKQKEPSCPFRMQLPSSTQNWVQKQFLSLLGTTRDGLLKTKLAGDTVVPAIIMAYQDKKFLQMYRDFLETDGHHYKHNPTQINATFALAEEEAQKPEYQNLLIGACPAVQIKRKWNLFQRKEEKNYDFVDNHKCPIIEHALSSLTKTRV